VTAQPTAIGTAASNPLLGCTPAGNLLCPTSAPYFWQAGYAGELVGSGAAASCCVTAALTSCPNSVPVIDSDAATLAGPLLGCIGTTPMLPASTGCPTSLPAAGDFTFFVASYVTIGTSTNNPGNVIKCRRNTASRQCRSALPVRPYASTVPSGCLTNLDVTVNGIKTTPTECPLNGYMAGRGFTFPLWQPTTPGSSGDATAKLEACITPPIASGARSCQGVVPANTWTSDISNDTLATLAASPAYLLGCARSEASCPMLDGGKTPTYPLINAALKIKPAVPMQARWVQQNAARSSTCLCALVQPSTTHLH
jgi:hypothetical protein